MPTTSARQGAIPTAWASAWLSARKVTVNTITAGERLFVDLLPDTWKGLPPGLPQEVVENLTRRARDAENKVRQQRHLVQERKHTAIRVRVGNHRTFTRYVFRLPELIGVSADRGDDSLTLKFDAPLKFDLSEAKAALPPVIEALDLEFDDEKSAVRFAFLGKVDVRTFREDNSYVSTSVRRKRAAKISGCRAARLSG